MARARRETAFADVVGKTVESIKYEESSDWQGLEVAFSDGTLLSFEMTARVTAHANYLKVERGDLKLVREYGQFSRNSGRRE
jgi:hypothetical protein